MHVIVWPKIKLIYSTFEFDIKVPNNDTGFYTLKYLDRYLGKRRQHFLNTREMDELSCYLRHRARHADI